MGGMKLKDLIKKLADKPNQESEVDFVVYEKDGGNIVCIELNGKKTTAVMKALASK